MDLMTPVRQETMDNLVFDAGLLLKDLDYSSATDATSLATLVAAALAAGTGVLGATKGGVNPQTNYTFWEPEMDGLRMSFKGGKRVESVDCMISGTLVEFTPDNAVAVIGAADKTGSGDKITVQPRFNVESGDYIDNLIWIGNWGADGLILIDLQNALCTKGMNAQTADKGNGTIPFEFHGHAASVGSDELPIKYLFFKAAQQSGD